MLGGGQPKPKLSKARSAPKPFNTPSLRKENNGQDATIAIVPTGGDGWGTTTADDKTQPIGPLEEASATHARGTRLPSSRLSLTFPPVTCRGLASRDGDPAPGLARVWSGHAPDSTCCQSLPVNHCQSRGQDQAAALDAARQEAERRKTNAWGTSADSKKDDGQVSAEQKYHQKWGVTGVKNWVSGRLPP